MDPGRNAKAARRRAALAALLASMPVAAGAAGGGAPEGFVLGGSLRARFEALDGQFRPAPASDTAVVLLRADILATYRAGPWRFGAEVQDARAYGERRRSSIGTSDVDTFEPVQAFVEARLGTAGTLQIGRFTMDIGSRRLVARANFRNTTNAFTGARWDWRANSRTSLTAFWTMPQNIRPDTGRAIRDNDVAIDRERPGLRFFGLTGTVRRVLGGDLDAYAYRLYETDSASYATRDRRLWTLGGRLARKPAKGALDYDVEAAWQGGHSHATTAPTDRRDLEVRAGFVHAGIGWTFAAPWSPRLAFAYDYASGDGRGRHYGRFDTLYGDRSFEFGPTDIYGPVSRANLSSPEIRVEARPGARWDTYLAVRGLWLASDSDGFAATGVRDAAGRSGDYAGTQIDGRVRYWLVPETLRLAAGAAVLIKGRFLNDAPNAPDKGDTRFGYVELSYEF